MQHKLHEFEDHQDQPLDSEERYSGCSICEGDLAYCKTCGGAEGSMPSECPGVQMTSEQIDQVYAGVLDYRNGQWVNECSPYSPRGIDQDSNDAWIDFMETNGR